MTPELIKSLRLSHNWTQKELACRLGISNVNLSNIERGKAQNVRPSTIYNLKTIFGQHTCIHFPSFLPPPLTTAPATAKQQICELTP